MRIRHVAVLAAIASALLAAPALAATGASAITSEEVAVTYAHGGVDVFEIASGAKGSLLALPIPPGAQGIAVQGGKYFFTQKSSTGRAAMVQSASGSAQATFRVPYPANGNFLFVWSSPAPIARLVLLAGPKIHPSGLGIAPFTLGGDVQLGGKQLTSFTATKLAAGYTMRWPFEVGNPGGWLGNVFTGIAIAVPLLALVLGLRSVLVGMRRREAADS